MRQFPRQILRDLDRFHNRRLADWWRAARGADGELLLSSYELLTYLEFMDEEGAFKTAAERGGRWPGWKQMLAEIANEGYRMRSAFGAANSEDGAARFDTEDFEFTDPIDLAERQKRAAAEGDEDAEAQARFEAESGLA